MNPAPRTVRPRRLWRHKLPIIAAHGDWLWSEVYERFIPAEFLPRLISMEPPSLFVAERMGKYLLDLTETFGDHPDWQFKIKPIERELYAPDRPHTKRFVQRTVVCSFGFGRNRNHFPIEPSSFVLAPIRDLIPEGNSDLERLITFGRDVRDWLHSQGIKPSPSAGGVAAALLKDPRFYPEPRRKVPRRTNETARERLPGNLYKLLIPPRQIERKATYIDMESSHHYCAGSLSFPDANSLYAQGNFRTLDNRPMAGWKSALNQHGLFYGLIRCPHDYPGAFLPPYMTRPGTTCLTYFYSNEIADIRAVRGNIEYVIACWTSPQTEGGLNVFSTFAREELGQGGDNRLRWLKPSLLTTYGLLATRPKAVEFGFHRARNGERVEYPCDNRAIRAYRIATRRAIESGIVNVIHRGMIEAEQRRLVLSLARLLHRSGVRVLALYADSVFVDSRDPLPLLPEPWRIKGHLDNLRFWAPNAFTSTQLERLPGVPREDRARAARLMQMRNLADSVIH